MFALQEEAEGDKEMNINICHWKPEDAGNICMPLLKNIPYPKKDDWKLVDCPICGNGCWETDAHRELLIDNPCLKAACTECALKAGSGRAQNG